MLYCILCFLSWFWRVGLNLCCQKYLMPVSRHFETAFSCHQYFHRSLLTIGFMTMICCFNFIITVNPSYPTLKGPRLGQITKKELDNMRWKSPFLLVVGLVLDNKLKRRKQTLIKCVLKTDSSGKNSFLIRLVISRSWLCRGRIWGVIQYEIFSITMCNCMSRL